MIALQQSLPVKSFDAATLSAGNGTPFALLANACQVTWQTIFGSTPSAVSVSIQTSLDGTTWSTVDTSTVTAGAVRSFVTSAIFIRAVINSATGGTTVTVSIVAKFGLLGLTTPISVTDGSLVLFDGTTGNKFKELVFPGDATKVLLGDGSFGPSPGGGGGGDISGTIADGQVAFGTGTDEIGGSDNLLSNLDGDLFSLGQVVIGDFDGENEGLGLIITSLAEGELSPTLAPDTAIASMIFSEANYVSDLTMLGEVNGISNNLIVDSTDDAGSGAQISSVNTFLTSNPTGTKDMYQLNGLYQTVQHASAGTLFSMLGYSTIVQVLEDSGNAENIWGASIAFGGFAGSYGVAIGLELNPLVGDDPIGDELYALVINDTTGGAAAVKNIWSKGATSINTFEGIVEAGTVIPTSGSVHTPGSSTDLRLGRGAHDGNEPNLLIQGGGNSFVFTGPGGGGIAILGASLVTFEQATQFSGGTKSSDGTAGATAGPFTVITGITVKNGLVTALTGS